MCFLLKPLMLLLELELRMLTICHIICQRNTSKLLANLVRNFSILLLPRSIRLVATTSNFSLFNCSVAIYGSSQFCAGWSLFLQQVDYKTGIVGGVNCSIKFGKIMLSRDIHQSGCNRLIARIASRGWMLSNLGLAHTGESPFGQQRNIARVAFR